MEKSALSAADLYKRAETYCASAEHCSYEVRRKITDWGGTQDMADDIISSLIAKNYINQQRFVAAYVHDKLLYQGWGRVKIHAMLSHLQIEESLIDEALTNIDPNEYMAVLRKVASKKKKADKNQMMRFLYQRGFTLEEIYHFADSIKW